MLNTVRACVLAFTCFAAGAALAAPNVADPSKYVTTSVTVSGAVQNALTLNVQDLAGFGPSQTTELTMVSQSEASRGKQVRLKGVRLRDILAKAALVSREHNDSKKTVVVASASDGYKVVFSWNELFNTPVGDGVLVFFERDGKPLDDGEGRIALMSTVDLRAGPRHVKWLQGIEVRKIAE